MMNNRSQRKQYQESFRPENVEQKEPEERESALGPLHPENLRSEHLKRKDSQRENWNQKESEDSEEPEVRPRKRQKSARDCALTLLEYCDRTEQEMQRKLKEREYSQEEIGEAIAFLTEYHYLDDEEYACRYIRTHSARKSIRKLRMELEQKGIPREFIEAALEDNPVEESAQIEAWIRKKGFEPGERLEPDQYRRLMASLGRRGYSFDAVRRVMDGD